jgi:hypothetical protein
LREESEDDNWRVYALPDVEPGRGPLGPIDIRFVQRSTGCGYSLSPLSRVLILKRFPQTHLVQSVLLSGAVGPEFEQTQSRFWEYIAQILTGLSEQQIEQLGGYRIFDYRAKRFVRETPLVARTDPSTRSPLTASPPGTSLATSIGDQSRGAGSS